MSDIRNRFIMIFIIGLSSSLALESRAADAPTYSEKELHNFDELRKSPFVTQKNFLIPQSRPSKDRRAFDETIKELNSIRERISKGKADEQEIHSFFNFRERTLNYRLQLIHHLHAERGGALSKIDPNLDRDEIQDPTVKTLYEDYLKAQRENYRGHKEALRSIGIALGD